jgi:uncharacterized repeat protein (TIGR02059 family)
MFCQNPAIVQVQIGQEAEKPPVEPKDYLEFLTTSNSATFSPDDIINSGGDLTWTVNGGQSQTISGSVEPVFDLSGNVDTDTIRIKSLTDFVGLTKITFTDKAITGFDVSLAQDLYTFEVKIGNTLSEADVTSNLELGELVIRDQLITSIDISSNPDLFELWAYRNSLNYLDISNNPLLTTVSIHGNNLQSATLDSIVNQLDSNGLSNGRLDIINNAGSLTGAVYTAYQNLIARGWTIDVGPPDNPADAGLTPVLSAFYVDDVNPDRVYFDASADITGLTQQGFTVSGKTLEASNGLVIDGDGLGGYLDVTVPFTYWDNLLVWLEGGNGTVHDFMQVEVDNRISEPSSTGSTYYVTTSGNDGNDGLSEGNAWRTLAYADGQLSAGDILYVKAGNYGDDKMYLVNRAGTAANPIKIIGYKNTPGDITTNYYDYGVAWSTSEMPTVDGNGAVTRAFEATGASYLIVKNFQYTDHRYGMYFANTTTANNIHVERCNFLDQGDVSTDGASVYSTGIANTKMRFKDCVFNDASDVNIVLMGNNNSIIDCKSYGERTDNNFPDLDLETDYYYIISGLYNTIIGSIAERKGQTDHGGHGISLKNQYYTVDNTYAVERNLVKNCVVKNINGAVELRHATVQDNYVYNVEMDASGGGTTSAGLVIRDGAKNNVVDACEVHSIPTGASFYGAVYFTNTSEDQSSNQNITGNIIKNCIFRDGGANVHAINWGTTGTYAYTVSGNKFYNNTFDNFPRFQNKDGIVVVSSDNEFKNNIFNDVTVLGDAVANVYDYNLFFNGFAAQGTNTITIDPQMDISYVPGATFTDIDVPALSSVKYDKNSRERNRTLTTAGAQSHSEEPSNTENLSTPVLSAFYVDDTNPDRVYYTSSDDESGLTTQGFTISGKTVSGINTTDNYITVSTPFTYWDFAITIKLENGNGVVHDFYLNEVVNNISEPTNSTIKYVAVGASGSGDSTGDPMSWSDAQSVSAGTTVYWKAGNYGAINFTQTNSGTSTAPIKHIGYKTTPGDAAELTRSVGMAFDSAEMPLIDSFTGNAFYSVSKQYVIFKNFQVSNGTTAFYIDNSDYHFFENTYIDDMSSFGILTIDSGSLGNKIKRSYVANCSSVGYRLYNHNNVFDDVYACTSEISSMDYYISLYGGTGSLPNLVKDSYVYRLSTDNHGGHGVDLKAGEEVWTLENTLVENNELVNVNQSLTVRHRGTKYNVFRGNTVRAETAGNGNGIVFHDGGAYNVFDGNTIIDKGNAFRWYESSEDEEDYANKESGNNNLIINNVIDGVYAILDVAFYDLDDHVVPFHDNKWYNNTFHDVTYFYKEDTETFDSTNEFKNNIFDGVAIKGTGSENITFDYNLFNASWTTSYGTNSISADPQLDASYVPQALFASIGVPQISGLYYDYYAGERESTTTAGAVKHTDELSAPDTTAPLYVSSSVENGAPSSLVINYDEPLDATSVPATTDFSVNDGLANPVTNVSISGLSTTLTLTNEIDNGDTVTLSYTKGTNPIQDDDANEAVNLVGESVTNNVLGATEIYPTGNAASIGASEGNSTGSWLGVSATLTSESGDTYDGTYALKINSNTTGTCRGEITWTQTLGTDVTVTFRMKVVQGSWARSYAWTGFTASPDTGILNDVDDGTWIEYSYTLTPSSTEGKMRIYSTYNTSGTIGDNVLVDSITITQ